MYIYKYARQTKSNIYIYIYTYTHVFYGKTGATKTPPNYLSNLCELIHNAKPCLQYLNKCYKLVPAALQQLFRHFKCSKGSFAFAGMVPGPYLFYTFQWIIFALCICSRDGAVRQSILRRRFSLLAAW